MNKTIRSLVEKIGENRNSFPILYFTSHKNPTQLFGGNVASDTLRYFLKILKKSEKDKVTLILNTYGGDIDMPWPLVNYIREYSKSFEVLVLNEAMSAGTLICLGADNIVMLPYSHLSPIDPAKTIQDEKNGRIPKKLEIEDIIGFVDFSKQKIGITEQSSLIAILNNLCNEINPTVLGSINRGYSLIRHLAKQMLSLHNKPLSQKQSEEIIRNLTQDLYSHNHRINRNEAKETIGFNDIIEYADEKTLIIAEKLIESTHKHLQIDQDFDPSKIVKDDKPVEITVPRALIYSNTQSFECIGKYSLYKAPDPSGKISYNINHLSSKWEENVNNNK